MPMIRHDVTAYFKDVDVITRLKKALCSIIMTSMIFPSRMSQLLGNYKAIDLQSTILIATALYNNQISQQIAIMIPLWILELCPLCLASIFPKINYTKRPLCLSYICLTSVCQTYLRPSRAPRKNYSLSNSCRNL